MATVQDLLRAGADLPSDSPRRDTEILLCHCLDKPRAWLYTWPERDVPFALADKFATLLQKRRQGQPVAYLTGLREFWTLQLAVNNATLIPRPETETLVDWALQLPLPADAQVLDLGTGSGAIALAVASERPGWRVTGVDSSEGALEVARHNAQRAELPAVSFVQSNWYEALAGQRYHLLLANPPYIEDNDPHLQQGDLRFEPRSALVAADSGLADLRRIINGASAHLAGDGWLLLEHGFEQGAAVRALLQAAGLREVATRADMAGRERISGGCRNAE